MGLHKGLGDFIRAQDFLSDRRTENGGDTPVPPPFSVHSHASIANKGEGLHKGLRKGQGTS